MKFAFLFFNLLVASALAGPAEVTCIFDHAPEDPAVEYVVEERQPDGTWLAVGSGPASPIRYVKTIPFGMYHARVFVRLKASPLSRDTALDTSSVAQAIVRPLPPTNPRLEAKPAP